MAIYQGASERSRGLLGLGGLLRAPRSDEPRATASGRRAGVPDGSDRRPVAGRRPANGRAGGATRAAIVAMRPVAPTRSASPAGPRVARLGTGARPTAPAGRPASPAVRPAATGSRGGIALRVPGVHPGRALSRGAAQVPRRTIAVAVHRPRTAALGIAAVAAVLLAVLFYLSQTFQAAAARYELDTLATERAVLLQELRSQDGIVTRWGSEGEVVQWAQDADLDPLGRRRRFEAP